MLFMNFRELTEDKIKLLHKGTVIPALPLAVHEDRRLDERRQRALFRYYLNAGAGGVAVGVHTTQFAIRSPKVNLYEPLLRLANEEFDNYYKINNRPVIRIAGATGNTKQAVNEARLASDNNFDAVLLSLAAFKDADNNELLVHCRQVAEVMPLFGFYLQPSVGGRKLDVDFWREFAAIDNVIAVKIAPFNRYHTLDVVRGVVESGRAVNVALYTGNDDNILVDLLTEFHFNLNNTIVKKRIVGGLLGHWSVWTRSAVKLLKMIQEKNYQCNMQEMLTLASQITDSNAAFFDAANGFTGCITGIHEVLRRQGLLENLFTLDEKEILSPGQKEEIDRVYAAYPHLNDDEFVKENLKFWLQENKK